jgi:ABC-type glycerol-3-phosphate transport system substrate-binding protein
LPPLAQDDAGLDREFHTIAASTAVRAVRLADRRDLDAAETFSFHRNLATGEPRLGSPGFVYALELMQRLQRCRAPADSRPPPEAFASGQAVLCLADATWIARFQKASPAPHFGIARVPGSRKVGDVRTGKLEEVPGGNYVPYLGATGALGVVLQTCRQADAAFALLADLAGKPTSAQVLFDERWGGAPLRRQHLEDAKGWSSFNLDQAQTNALLQALILTVTHPGLSNPATRLRQPDEREYAPVLAAELRAALSGEKDAARALEDAAARWRDIDRRKPEGQVRAYYAYSLGLIP